MDKKVTTAFGKKVYLLGKDHDGIYYWLEAPSWDCGWYWGFGYVENYTNNKRPDLSKDIACHQHFNGLFFNKGKWAFETFNEFFAETPLNKNEVWLLLDYMNTFYTLKAAAEILGRGYSHFTERAKLETIQRPHITDSINKEMLPELFEKIESLLSD